MRIYKLFFVVFCVFFMTESLAGSRLLATGGVVEIEGVSGGGLTPWALITGYSTDNEIGAHGYFTKSKTNGGFDIDSYGFGIALGNKVEFSVSQIDFGLSNTIPGQRIRLDTFGAKFKLYGDAIYDQDSYLPQVSAGLMFKRNQDFDLVPKALNAKNASGTDFYLSATKLYLAAIDGNNLLLNATLLATKENQFGILGFGGDNNNSYKIEPAFSLAIMIRDNIIIGGEYRFKPNNLEIYKEEDAKDIFVAWFPMKNFSITTAYVDLGNIANKSNQRAWYLSGQLSY